MRAAAERAETRIAELEASPMRLIERVAAPVPTTATEAAETATE